MDALIRSVQLDPLPTRLSELRAGSVPDRSEALRKEIESQVRAELRQQAREQYESARAQGLADGRADAVGEAKQESAQELRRAIDRLTAEARSGLATMQQAHAAALQKLETSVGEVAFAALCRLIGEQTAPQALVLGIVKRTCAELRAELQATVRLHPRDIDVLRDLLQNQELRLHSLGLKVVPDETLQPGGCVIEAASGHYDGGLETQLRRLHAILTGSSRAPGSKG